MPDPRAMWTPVNTRSMIPRTTTSGGLRKQSTNPQTFARTIQSSAATCWATPSTVRQARWCQMWTVYEGILAVCLCVLVSDTVAVLTRACGADAQGCTIQDGPSTACCWAPLQVGACARGMKQVCLLPVVVEPPGVCQFWNLWVCVRGGPCRRSNPAGLRVCSCVWLQAVQQEMINVHRQGVCTAVHGCNAGWLGCLV